MPEFWTVNSYSYPNPFNPSRFAKQAWATLESFTRFDSYTSLKEYWKSASAPRLLDSHAVESWKATFEEFGLLYVLTRSDDIVITPAGRQFLAAGTAGNAREFGWIGLNLLLRYPLKGPRRPKGPRHVESDILLYWFLYAAMRELQNYIWWSELTGVLCLVFRTDEAQGAIDTIRGLRSGKLSISDCPPPVSQPRGKFYNTMNQLIVHAGMYYMTMDGSNDEAFYESKERRHWINSDWLDLIDLALGDQINEAECDGGTRFVTRMPKAPEFADDEQAYFDYLGAAVPSMTAATPDVPVIHTTLGGGSVAILTQAAHYIVPEPLRIRGEVRNLCKLAKGQRVILSHDLAWSYIVEEKVRSNATDITVRLRQARPITNPQPIQALLEGNSD
jgi:hypothetical protein